MRFRFLSLLLIFFLFCSAGIGFFHADSYNSVSAFSEKIPEYEENLTNYDLFKNYSILRFLPFFGKTGNSEEIYVYPSGQSCGLKVLTDGVLVLSTAGSTDSFGNIVSPGKDAGIEPGDYIISFNGIKVKNTEHLENLIAENQNKPVTLELKRQEKVYTTKVFPESYDNINYVLGLWVRDSTAGLGTLTYFTKDKKNFAALGHSVSDSDTGEIMNLKRGELLSSSIISVKKGYSGIPGELVGVFEKPEVTLGEITSNNEYGIYGNLSSKDAASGIESVPVAKKSEIKTGPAKILSTTDGSTPEYYNINIIKIIRKASQNGKNMIIEVTDKKLLEKTGGIVQGMSGSPILQNGKLVGAVTHVFVNDPTRGYGIFIENMLDETKNLKNR